MIEAYLGTERGATRHDRPHPVQADGIDVFYGASQILFGVELELAAGTDHGAARPQRRRQEHDHEGDRRPRPAAPRPASASPASTSTAASRYLIARAGLGFVPEDRQVFPEHTVEDNLVIAAKKGPDGQDDWTADADLRTVSRSAGAAASAHRRPPVRAASSRCWPSPGR